jgi:hypothetical protein
MGGIVMNLFNEDKKDKFTSTIAIETVNNLDDKKMNAIIDQFKGHYFDVVKYHIMEHCNIAALMLYCNNAPSDDEYDGSTLHVIFCVDSTHEQLAKPMVEVMYKRFIRIAHESVEGNMHPVFSIGEATFAEALSNSEENKEPESQFGFGHQHPLLDIIENIWNEEENDDNREEGKII